MVQRRVLVIAHPVPGRFRCRLGRTGPAGGSRPGLTGRSLPSLAYPPDEELAHAAVQQVLAEGLDRCQVEGRWVRINSRELVWGAWDLSLVRDRRGRPELAIAVVRDLTEMKRSDHERRFSSSCAR